MLIIQYLIPTFISYHSCPISHLFLYDLKSVYCIADFRSHVPWSGSISSMITKKQKKLLQILKKPCRSPTTHTSWILNLSKFSRVDSAIRLQNDLDLGSGSRSGANHSRSIHLKFSYYNLRNCYNFFFFKGLVAGCHSFCLFSYFLEHTVHNIHSISIHSSVCIRWSYLIVIIMGLFNTGSESGSGVGNRSWFISWFFFIRIRVPWRYGYY